jgi:phenylalanyl-tRNA synthetase beta subunit
MKASYNWINEHVDGNLPEPKELAKILTRGAYEVESIEEIGNDFVFDIDVQPNRAHDSFGHYGIAKESGILAGIPLKPYEAVGSQNDFETELNVRIEDERCKRYVGREIKNVKIEESPEEIKQKLEVLGQRSINNIVDLTNIVMFELGQPMHAFDKDKLSGSQIVVRKSNKGDKFTTLDNKEVEFEGKEMVIADEKDTLAIAGIKGGNKAEVDSNTTNLILESANFDSVAVRFTRRDVGIETDSSKRFERGITPTFADIAMRRLTDLIMEYASTDKTEVSNIVDEFPRPPQPFYTGVSVEEVEKILGTPISKEEISDIFKRLGFEFEYLNTKEFIVNEAPQYLGRPHNLFPSLTYDAPKEFDCSSLTAYLYAHGGKSIPRMTVDQYVFGKEISKEELEPGDLIFSNSKEGKIHTETVEFVPGTPVPEGVDHVGVYVGDEMVIHSTRFKGSVVEENLSESEHFQNIVGYRRIVDKNEMRFAIRVPDERLDIRTKVDVIEEIARVYGYDNIETHEVKRGDSERVIEPNFYYISKISNWLIENGFSEVMTYTLRDSGDVELANPFASDKKFMRDSLIPGLTESLELNTHNSDLLALDEVKIFEVGKVFRGEKEYWSIGLGLNITNTKQGKIKEAFDEIVNSLKEEIGDLKIEVKDNLAEINISKSLENLPEPNENYNLAEVNNDVIYKPFSQYPFVLRDIAVWVPSGKTEEDVLKIIKEEAGDLFVNQRLFDVFEKDGRTSYAFRIVFQSEEKTLTDEEVNVFMDKITEKLNSNEGWKVR